MVRENAGYLCYNFSMIKAIGFDYGGVVEIKEGNLFQEIAKYLNINLEDWNQVYFSLNHLHNIGKGGGDETVFLTAKEFGATEEQIAHIKDLILDIRKTKKINSELLEMIGVLKSKGYKIGLLSNNGANLNQRIKDQNLADFFDTVVISSETGYQKPQPEIFKILADKLGVGVNEMVFIDDTQKSLEGAESIGYIPILFENNSKLKEDLSVLEVFK